MEKALNIIMEDEKLKSELMESKSFEEIYDIFKKVDDSIDEKQFEDFFVNFFNEIEKNLDLNSEMFIEEKKQLNAVDLSKVSGGKISRRVVSATLAFLMAVPVVGAQTRDGESDQKIEISVGEAEVGESVERKEVPKTLDESLISKLKKMPLWAQISSGIAGLTIPVAIIASLLVKKYKKEDASQIENQNHESEQTTTLKQQQNSLQTISDVEWHNLTGDNHDFGFKIAGGEVGYLSWGKKYDNTDFTKCDTKLFLKRFTDYFKPNGKIDLEHAKNANIRYWLEKAAMAQADPIKNDFYELESEINQELLITALARTVTDKSVSPAEKQMAKRIIKMLLMARMGEVKYERAHTEDEGNDNDKYFKSETWTGRTTDLFAYGNTVLFDINLKSTESLNDVAKIFSDNFFKEGEAESSTHDMYLDEDGTLHEKKITVKNGLSDHVAKVVGKMSPGGDVVGCAGPISITSYVDKNKDGTDKIHTNYFKMLIRRFGDRQRAGIFGKIESAAYKDCSRYGHVHETSGKSELISAMGAVRANSPFAKRDGILINLGGMSVPKIKEALDAKYDEIEDVCNEEKAKALLKTWTDALPNKTGAGDRRKQIFGADVDATFSRELDSKAYCEEMVNTYKFKADNGAEYELALFKSSEKCNEDHPYRYFLHRTDRTPINSGDLLHSIITDYDIGLWMTEGQKNRLLRQLSAKVTDKNDKAKLSKVSPNLDDSRAETYRKMNYFSEDTQSDKALKKFVEKQRTNVVMMRKDEGTRTFYSFFFTDAFKNNLRSELDKGCDWANEMAIKLKNKCTGAAAVPIITWRDIIEEMSYWWFNNASSSSEKEDTFQGALEGFGASQVVKDIETIITKDAIHKVSIVPEDKVDKRYPPKYVTVGELNGNPQLLRVTSNDRDAIAIPKDRFVRECMVRHIFIRKNREGCLNQDTKITKGWKDTALGVISLCSRGAANLFVKKK